jgi:hypothetical protein
MPRIESSLSPRPYILLDTYIHKRGLGIRAFQIHAAEEERLKQEMQWAIPDSQKIAASVSMAKSEAAISGLIAGIKKAQLSALLS